MRTLGAFVLSLLVASGLCGHTFDAFRMAQFDAHGQAFGSRRTRVDYVAAPPTTTDNFSRKMIVVKFADVTAEQVREFSNRENIDGVLILLPQDLDAVLSANQELVERWREVESQLTQSTILIPVYFAFEDAQLTHIYDKVTGGWDGDGTQFVTEDNEAKPLKSSVITNIIGTLVGTNPDTQEQQQQQQQQQTPKLLVVAHYDSFGVAPDLGFGVDSNGSGVAALLELARVFSRIYKTGTNPPSHDLVFLLSAGGVMNFDGSRNWIEENRATVLDSIDFVLCLDSLATSTDLYLHSTKNPKKDPAATAMHNLLTTSAEVFGVALEHKHIKVNGSTSQVRWEHEMFAKRKIPAATLSSRSFSAPLLQHHSIVDRSSVVDSTILVRNIKIVAEALARYIFDLPTTNVLGEGAFAVDSNFVEAWLNVAASFPRTPINIPTNYTAALLQVLEDHGAETVIQEFAADPAYTFYDTTRVKMSALRVKSIFFDLILAGAVGAYLFVLNNALKRDTLSNFLAKLAPTSANKSKRN